jgi:predicted phosphate transport protein (TIGR00153 family)
MFKTKKDYFFITLEQITDNILTATQKFATDVHDLSNTSLFAKEMKDLEHKGDKFTHEIIKELNKRFITPIDRQDILKLVTSLDDIIDDIEAIASRFDLYEMKKIDEFVKMFAENLTKSVAEIHAAILHLHAKNYTKIREHVIRIHELENQADDLLRSSIRNLFKSVTDPIELMKRKEIYEMLEDCSDRCEDVANNLETIMMTNS